MNNKVESYIGFSIRKGAAVFGVDNITVTRKHVHVILHTSTLSPKSLSNLCFLAEKIGVPIFCVEEFDILQKKNCKAIAVCDKSLAKAIIENLK